ncbi:MAG: ester cyclase [Pseudomonadota bacterium]
MSIHDDNKAWFSELRAALYDIDPAHLRRRLTQFYAPDAEIAFCYPFGRLAGPEALFDQVYAPLIAAMPDIERRDFIFMAGARWGQGNSGNWIGLGGNIVGRFDAPWLGIPPTGRPVFLRYHEYYRVEARQIVEMTALWDIPQLMVQAGAWPFAPQTGVEWMCPGPADGQGIKLGPHDATTGDASVQLVWDMLHDLQRGDADAPLRAAEGYWHPKCLWYGPTGLGTGRRPAGFQDVVLKGFRTGLSNNIRFLEDGVFFGEGSLVAFTGWPSGQATHSGEGFLGLAPTCKTFTRRSLDFWRCENGQIRENWVLVDLLDIYHQLGVDPLARMRDFVA